MALVIVERLYLSLFTNIFILVRGGYIWSNVLWCLIKTCASQPNARPSHHMVLHCITWSRHVVWCCITWSRHRYHVASLGAVTWCDVASLGAVTWCDVASLGAVTWCDVASLGAVTWCDVSSLGSSLQHHTRVQCVLNVNYDWEQTQIFETKHMSSLSIEDDGNYASEEELNQPLL